MSSQTLKDVSAPAKYPSLECRVWERFPCGLQTTCQPIAARGQDELSWSAHIRDLSVGGVGVVLKRRFERGAALATGALIAPGADRIKSAKITKPPSLADSSNLAC